MTTKNWDSEFDAEPPRDRWLLSFADLLTLLLAFFVVMYSVSAVNESKLSDLAASLSETFSSERVAQHPITEDDLIEDGMSQFVTNAVKSNLSSQIELQIDHATQGQSAITILLPGSVLFDSGSSNVGLQGRQQLTALIPLLKGAVGPVQVAGHTDDITISNEQYPSNWELSAHRASATVRFFEQHGLIETSFVVLAYGDTQPIETNQTERGRASNRRIVINVEALDWQAAHEAASLVKDATREDVGQDARENPALINLNQDDSVSRQLQGVDDVDPELLEQVLKSMEAEAN